MDDELFQRNKTPSGVIKAIKFDVLTEEDIVKYSIDELLSESDRSTMLRVLNFHPHKNEKFGIGPQDIKVGWHPKYKDSRCFHIIRTDGTVEDFSYRKCILGALDIVDPKKSKIQEKKWSGHGDK